MLLSVKLFSLIEMQIAVKRGDFGIIYSGPQLSFAYIQIKRNCLQTKKNYSQTKKEFLQAKNIYFQIQSDLTKKVEMFTINKLAAK